MIQRYLVKLFRKELATLDTLSFERTERLKAAVNESLGQSFGAIKIEIEKLKVELAALKATSLDHVLDLQAVTEAIAQEVDVLAGMIDAVDNKVDTLNDMNDAELDDLEERIKDLESK